MLMTRLESLTMIGITLWIALGSASMNRGGESSSAVQVRDSVVCRWSNETQSFGPVVLSDFSDGVSSDGRGPYIQETDGVVTSAVNIGAWLTMFSFNGDTTNQRRFTVNLNNPVPGGGGVPLGTIRAGNGTGLLAEWHRVGNATQNLHAIPLGQTVTAAQMNVVFHLNGRLHVLQMGPQPNGHCHFGGRTLVHGAGTSSGTIYRASQTKWMMDLPAGSVGRLFDVSNTTEQAVDRGLYYLRLHYEIDAFPLAAGMLRRVAAETQNASGVVARYRALQRDSAKVYFLGGFTLIPAGNWLLENKKPAEAAIVFRLSVEEHPANWMAYQRLGEAYLGVGDTTKAIATYRRSLDLNPNNRNAAEGLKRLGTKP